MNFINAKVDMMGIEKYAKIADVFILLGMPTVYAIAFLNPVKRNAQNANE